jgi:hypothetical protein
MTRFYKITLSAVNEKMINIQNIAVIEPSNTTFTTIRLNIPDGSGGMVSYNINKYFTKVVEEIERLAQG